MELKPETKRNRLSSFAVHSRPSLSSREGEDAPELDFQERMLHQTLRRASLSVPSVPSLVRSKTKTRKASQLSQEAHTPTARSRAQPLRGRKKKAARKYARVDPIPIFEPQAQPPLQTRKAPLRRMANLERRPERSQAIHFGLELDLLSSQESRGGSLLEPRRRDEEEESGELEMEMEMPLECGWDQVSQLPLINQEEEDAQQPLGLSREKTRLRDVRRPPRCVVLPDDPWKPKWDCFLLM